jgi:hypothetical protein
MGGKKRKLSILERGMLAWVYETPISWEQRNSFYMGTCKNTLILFLLGFHVCLSSS